jgi:hypothetical protein
MPVLCMTAWYYAGIVYAGIVYACTPTPNPQPSTPNPQPSTPNSQHPTPKRGVEVGTGPDEHSTGGPGNVVLNPT